MLISYQSLKKNLTQKISNYRPVSILTNLSKNFERLMFNQLSNYFRDILYKFQCGFRPGHTVHKITAVQNQFNERSYKFS